MSLRLAEIWKNHPKRIAFAGAGGVCLLIVGVVASAIQDRAIDPDIARIPEISTDATKTGSLPDAVNKPEATVSATRPIDAVERVALPSRETIRAGVNTTDPAPTRSKPVEEAVYFDRCMPGCNTRDRLAAETVNRRAVAVEPRPVGPAAKQRQAETVTPRSVVVGAGNLLGRVASLPATTLRMGRQTVEYATEAFE